MSKQISSVFDNMDMAEFARIRLKREGIDVEAYNIKQVYDRAYRDTDNTGVSLYPRFDIGHTNEALWMGSAGYQPYGGVLVDTDSDEYGNRTLKDDIYSDEINMSIKVPEDQVGLAEGIIRSCHGYSITIK